MAGSPAAPPDISGSVNSNAIDGGSMCVGRAFEDREELLQHEGRLLGLRPRERKGCFLGDGLAGSRRGNAGRHAGLDGGRNERIERFVGGAAFIEDVGSIRVRRCGIGHRV